MAKKSRRPRLSAAQRVRPGTATESVIVPTAEDTPRDLTEEYSYVLTDLKRIGIIALVMLALMITLMIVIV
jgi:hypothetical protein